MNLFNPILQLLAQYRSTRQFNDLYYARMAYRKLTREEQQAVSAQMAEKGWLGGQGGELIDLFDGVVEI